MLHGGCLGLCCFGHWMKSININKPSGSGPPAFNWGSLCYFNCSQVMVLTVLYCTNSRH
jgi:hypothetical protein